MYLLTSLRIEAELSKMALLLFLPAGAGCHVSPAGLRWLLHMKALFQQGVSGSRASPDLKLKLDSYTTSVLVLSLGKAS